MSSRRATRSAIPSRTRQVGAQWFWPSTVVMIACSAQPTDSGPSNPPSNAGTTSMTTGGVTGNTGGASSTLGGQGGAKSTGGATTSGGTVGTSGGTSAGGAAAGNTNKAGSTGTTGGVATTGGVGPAQGGAAPTGGSGGGSSSTCATAKLVYDGGMLSGTTCGSAVKPPLTGYFYASSDETSTQTPMKSTSGSYAGEAPGRGGAMDCAFHTAGKGFTEWGALIGTDMKCDSMPFNASTATGLQLYVKGTTSGTHGTGYAMADNTVRVTVKTNQVTGDDDFGGWCTLSADWTLCMLPFASMAQEGFGTAVTPATVNSAAISAISIKAAKLEAATEVDFDFWVDDISFY